MNPLNKHLLALSLAAVCACGQQLVQFPNATIPSVVSTDPGNAATGVAITRTVNATFSEAMDPATLNGTTFTLKQGATSVSGAVSYTGLVATFTPSANLTANTFTASIDGAKSAAGVAMAAPFTWSFTTSVVAPPPPTVVSTDPGSGSTGIIIGTSVNATFSRAMDPLTITATTFTLAQGATNVPGAVTYAVNTATFKPTAALAANLVYTATITAGAKDLSGLAMAAPFTWSFTTATATAAPTVVSTDPGSSSTGVLTTKQLSATFSRPMDPLTLTATTFTLAQGATNVPGAVAYSGSTATFTPTATLATNALYTATITVGAKDPAGIALAANYVWTFTTAAGASAPTVTSTDPGNNSLGVPVGKHPSAIFSRAMDPLTIVAATFTLKAGAVAVPGAVTYSGTTATFTPASALATNTLYTATITTGAKDPAAIALAADYVWTFNTGIAPNLITEGPADGATLVPLNTASTATFNEPMDPLTFAPTSTFSVKEFVSGNFVSGSSTYSGNTATFKPSVNLLPNTKYQSTVTTAAKDLAGNALVAGTLPNPWTWTTGPAADLQAPTITLTSPQDAATGVQANATVSATFSKAMDVQTMTTNNFTVKDSLNASVAGNVAYDVQNKVITFTPAAPLKQDTVFTATVTNGAKDLSGNALVVPAVNGLPKPNPWSFRTLAAPVPLAVNLRGAASYGLASRAGLTSTGVTVVNGDVALYPLAGCTDSTGNAGASQTCLVRVYTSPTGLTVNGFIYWAGDPFDNGGTANSVTNDLNVAWVEGTNKVDTLGPVAGDQLAGKVFLPGVYHNANLGLSANGIATMDAQGDANAVFFFKVDSDFVDSGTLLLPTKIVLVNQAKARNVWFITGRDLTIGSGTSWFGNILAGRTVTVNDGSTVLGRVLGGAGGAGAVTLTGAASPSITTITVPQ